MSKLSEKDKEIYDRRVLGQNTSTGTEVKSFSEHAYERLAQRRISPNRILQMIAQTPVQSKTDADCDVYSNNGSGIVVDRNTGNVVTIMWSRR